MKKEKWESYKDLVTSILVDCAENDDLPPATMDKLCDSFEEYFEELEQSHKAEMHQMLSDLEEEFLKKNDWTLVDKGTGETRETPLGYGDLQDILARIANKYKCNANHLSEEEKK